jgi:hypothetical protein
MKRLIRLYLFFHFSLSLFGTEGVSLYVRIDLVSTGKKRDKVIVIRYPFKGDKR